MNLDIQLVGDTEVTVKIRKWADKHRNCYPDKVDVYQVLRQMQTHLRDVKPEVLYTTNITHNLIPMWRRVGVYEELYNADGVAASNIVPALVNGLAFMRANPNTCRALEPANGHGTYRDALPFLQELHDACRLNSRAMLKVAQ